MASNGSQERLVRINGRIKWTEVGNHDILECKKQAQRLVNSENQKSATNVYIHIHPCEGDFSNRTIDTRTKGMPTKGDHENINKVITE